MTSTIDRRTVYSGKCYCQTASLGRLSERLKMWLSHVPDFIQQECSREHKSPALSLGDCPAWDRSRCKTCMSNVSEPRRRLMTTAPSPQQLQFPS